MKMRTGIFLIIIFTLVNVMACSVGPEYRRPGTASDKMDGFRSAPENVRQVISEDEFSRWWLMMNDPLMDEYVDLMLEENLQLKEAAARVGQAWAQLGIEKGARLPALSASGSALRGFQGLGSGTSSFGAPTQGFPGSGTAGDGSGAAVFSSSRDERIYFTRFEAGLSTSWQIDLFGRLERSIEAARKNFLASRNEAVALTHSLIAELARLRISLATLKRLIELAEETVENRQVTLQAVERRYRRGVGDTSAVDVYLARENKAFAAVRIPELRGQLIEQAYALDILLGRIPGTIDPMKTEIPLLPPPMDLPVGLPARLIDRRPDLMASELRMAAAVERMGVAVANLYPGLTLSGSIGWQNDELSDFFNSGNLFGTILGDLMMRIFEGGRLRANIDLQEMRARELAAVYAGQVLNAIEEVEVALSNGRYLSEQLELIKVRLENIRKAEKQMREKYRRGLASLLEVLETQRRKFDTEQSYLQTAQAAWNNRIALYLALGGDWLVGEPVIEPAPLPLESSN